ncbi:hypothetical protein SCHPADRAFT_503059 [Schizopora paradoxa]|uniref:Uncharacterized protein n=1 Tax=Schizopora paradoxa TaxID=27342 RepID=A0A0H2RMV5_9AGAM|nr:hypothetical protein SCHPADRAFT_503059 [Schizopora paradoxa]
MGARVVASSSLLAGAVLSSFQLFRSKIGGASVIMKILAEIFIGLSEGSLERSIDLSLSSKRKTFKGREKDLTLASCEFPEIDFKVTLSEFSKPAYPRFPIQIHYFQRLLSV